MASEASVHHPIFARLFAWGASNAPAEQTEHRRKLLQGLSGRVVEVGAGNGLNFPHYPAEVTEVLAVEPEPYLREKAVEAAAGAPVAITVVDGVADSLPSGDGEFDAAVASLVLCSVPDQATALAELRRVIRPGGELRFYEHVRADDPKAVRLQKRVDVAWPFFSGGCHITRRTEAAIVAAGFEVVECDRFQFEPCVLAKPVAPHILGRAIRP